MTERTSQIRALGLGCLDIAWSLAVALDFLLCVMDHDLNLSRLLNVECRFCGLKLQDLRLAVFPILILSRHLA